MITMLLSLFLSTAQAQVPNCLNGEIPLLENVFALGAEPEGCEAAMDMFIRIENRTEYCLQYRWSALGATPTVVKWYMGDPIPVVIMDQEGNPQSCAPPGSNSWAIAPAKGAMIEAVGYNNAPSFVPPTPVPLPNGSIAYLVGMTMGGIPVPSKIGTVCEARRTEVGTYRNHSAEYIRFDHIRCG